MAEEKRAKNQLKFKYIIPDHLQDCYVNGLWGGITPRDEVIIHFFSERFPIPKNEMYELEGNELNPVPVEKEAGGDVVRLIQSSVVMDIQTAVSLRSWLDNHLKRWDELKKNANDKEGEKDAE